MRTLLCIALLGCLHHLAAQTLAMTVSPKLNFRRDEGQFEKYLHHDAKGHYILLAQTISRTQNPIEAVTFQQYDETFKLLESTDIEMDDRFTTYDDCFYASGKFLLCTHREDKKENRFTYSATVINMDGTLKKPQKIHSLTWKDRDDKPTGTTWMMSKDTTKLLLATYADDDDAALKTRVTLAVHGPNLEKIWAKNVTLPYSQLRFNFESWTVDNQGRVYLLCKIYDENETDMALKRGKARQPYQIKVLRFDQGGTKPTEINIDVANKYPTDVSFDLTPTGDINCAGFYSDDRKMIAQGVFFTRLDQETGKSQVASQKAFTVDDLPLLRNSTQKDKSGDEGLASTFKFDRLVTRDDGSIVVTAENAYEQVSTTPNDAGFGGVRAGGFGNMRMGNTSRVIYYNLDVVVVSISPAGNIEWVRSIPKAQANSTNRFNSYTMMLTPTNLYFLYSDTESNIVRPLTEKPRMFDAFNGATTALVVIGRTGKMIRRRAFDNIATTQSMQIIPRQSAQIKPNELFFLGWSTRALRGSVHLGIIAIL